MLCDLDLYLRRSGGNRFILKDIPPSIHAAFRENIQPRLPHTPRIRIPLDTIPDRDILVYRYLTEDFLSLAKKQIPIQARKQILKTSLQGIAELHDRDIVHLGKLRAIQLLSIRSCMTDRS
jgi:hypothetical protein